MLDTHAKIGLEFDQNLNWNSHSRTQEHKHESQSALNEHSTKRNFKKSPKKVTKIHTQTQAHTHEM